MCVFDCTMSNMKLFRHSFRFRKDQSEYDFQMNHRFPWWLLLLLLALLVLDFFLLKARFHF